MRVRIAGPKIGPFGTSFSFHSGSKHRPPRQPQAKPSSDFIYVVTGAHGLTKVGFSADPVARLARLQTGSPERLWLAFTAPAYGNAYVIEQEAHQLLSAHRVRGEWFSATPDLAIAAIFGAADRTGCSLFGAAPEQPATGLYARLRDPKTWYWTIVLLVLLWINSK